MANMMTGAKRIRMDADATLDNRDGDEAKRSRAVQSPTISTATTASGDASGSGIASPRGQQPQRSTKKSRRRKKQPPTFGAAGQTVPGRPHLLGIVCVLDYCVDDHDGLEKVLVEYVGGSQKWKSRAKMDIKRPELRIQIEVIKQWVLSGKTIPRNEFKKIHLPKKKRGAHRHTRRCGFVAIQRALPLVVKGRSEHKSVSDAMAVTEAYVALAATQGQDLANGATWSELLAFASTICTDRHVMAGLRKNLRHDGEHRRAGLHQLIRGAGGVGGGVFVVRFLDDVVALDARESGDPVVYDDGNDDGLPLSECDWMDKCELLGVYRVDGNRQ